MKLTSLKFEVTEKFKEMSGGDMLASQTSFTVIFNHLKDLFRMFESH